MPHDITLTILLKPATHDLSATPEKAASRYRRGDIILAEPATKNATRNGADYIMHQNKGNHKFIYLHVTSVPDQFTIDIMNEKLCGEVSQLIPTDPPTYNTIRRRKFRIRPSIIPPAIRAEWLSNRELTVTFAQFKNHVWKKQVVNPLIPTQDDETSNVADIDLT